MVAINRFARITCSFTSFSHTCHLSTSFHLLTQLMIYEMMKTHSNHCTHDSIPLFGFTFFQHFHMTLILSNRRINAFFPVTFSVLYCPDKISFESISIFPTRFLHSSKIISLLVTITKSICASLPSFARIQISCNTTKSILLFFNS